ncbi:hypothetical protein Ancab_004620 [Ancistrocladus abbreviatus]
MSGVKNLIVHHKDYVYGILGVNPFGYMIFHLVSDIYKYAMEQGIPQPLNPWIKYILPGVNELFEVEDDNGLTSMFELFIDSDEIHLYITESKTPSAVVNLASSSGNLFPSQPYNDYECGDSEIDNMICKTHGSSAITNYGNSPGGVLGSNDVDVDVNAYVSGYITSDDEWLSNDEVRDATLSCLSDSSLLGSGDESSDDIDLDDLKMIDKVYASDLDVDDDTPSYLCGKFFDYNEDGSVSLQVGLMFCDKSHFIEVLTDFAVINGFNMFRFKHSRSRFTAVCSNDEECP